jgi:hypothetical protein
MPRLAGGCSLERLAEAQTFFADKRTPLIERSLERVSDAVHACARQRDALGAAVEAALKEESGR